MFAHIESIQWKTIDMDVALVGILSEVHHTGLHQLKKPGKRTVYIGRSGSG